MTFQFGFPVESKLYNSGEQSVDRVLPSFGKNQKMYFVWLLLKYALR